MTPLRAIRAKCRDCSCGSTRYVKQCPSTDCPLWTFRFGLRPATARRRYGPDLMDPCRMPESTVPLETLP
jgi:hypothetical protein